MATTRTATLVAFLAIALTAACDDTKPIALDSTGQPDTGSLDGQAPQPDGPVGDGATPDGTLPRDTGSACAVEIAALAAEMYASPAQSCTVVVRLDHDSLAPLGFQLVCGKYASGVTESTARATAQADSGYGSAGKMLNGTSPADEYVFYESPGDFGGAASVSARTGLTVFGGGIIWMGTGKITHPKTWRPVNALGSGCPAAGGMPQRLGYDLLNGSALAQTDVDKAVAVVLKTAVPAAMWKGGYVFDTVVLRYPRSVGAFDPKTAEWIVLVNGGWLE